MENFGIYEAVVTDNSSFFTHGTIKVRIKKLYNDDTDLNIKKNYNKDFFVQDLLKDLDAYIYSPIGGGENYGLFMLPQVGSIGIIQFLNGDTKKPVWMGTVFSPELDKNGNIIKTKIPNDDPYAEGANTDGATREKNTDTTTKKKTLSGENAIILRTKKTNSPLKSGGIDNVDFDKQRTENIIVISDEYVKITHFSKWQEKKDKLSAAPEQFEEISIGMYKEKDVNGNIISSKPQISVKVVDNNISNNGNNRITTEIKVENDNITVDTESLSRKTKSTITSHATDGIRIKSGRTDKIDKTEVQMNPTEMKLINGSVTLTLDKKSVTVSAPEGAIMLSGNEIRLGDGGGYVLIRDTPMFMPVKTEDGSFLRTSERVRA